MQRWRSGGRPVGRRIGKAGRAQAQQHGLRVKHMARNVICERFIHTQQAYGIYAPSSAFLTALGLVDGLPEG